MASGKIIFRFKGETMDKAKVWVFLLKFRKAMFSFLKLF